MPAFARPVRSRRGPRRPFLALALAGMACLSTLLSACGDSKGSGVARLGSTTSRGGHASSAERQGAVAFSSCMRSHGLPRFPDPGSGGELPKVSLRQLGVSSARFQAAQRSCRHLLPSNGDASTTLCFSTGDCPQALVQELMNGMLRFARCMRSHGVASWPDPTREPDNGAPVFDLLRVQGFDPNAPRIEHTMRECRQPGVRIALERP